MTERRRFPPHPIRGVHILRKPRGNCAPYINVTLDFEPAPEGFTFEAADGVLCDWEPPEEVPLFLEHLAKGLSQELHHEDHGITVATRAILRDARAHPVDSGEFTFLLGGRYAAREALAVAWGTRRREDSDKL
ncbi:hypothetical protein [Streptomyces sp. I05A-00742]|uniref:hypothetical protein n=1 Tax=Streptomyces sp. I05A-00742 TaxID=2732853 RepID=UPI0014896AE4|nr:hypothetical protein [Streptomyces sp. I05A-00742]